MTKTDFYYKLANNNEIYRFGACDKKIIGRSENFSFHFVLQGNADVYLNNRTIKLYPDCFLILNSGTHFTSLINSPTEAQILSLSFDVKFINDFINSWTRKNHHLLNGNIPSRLEPYFFSETMHSFNGDIKYNIAHLGRLISKGSRNELLMNEYLYHTLINYFVISYKEIFQRAEKLQVSNQATRTEIYRRLAIAKDYLYSNYDKDINIEDITSEACMSRTHLFSMFKQVYDLTPHQFLVQIRLKRAQFLLRKTDYSVNQIVSLVGFDSPNSFIRLFRTKFHVTPLIYRLSA